MAAQLNPQLGTRDASPILEPAWVRKIGNPRGDGEPVAVIVNHGMGQQVPYETIEGVAKAVQRGVARKETDLTALRWVVRRVRLGTSGNDEVETELVRAEVDITHAQKKYSVHIYESYWAPLTEGKVSLSDVMSFLLDAGVNGFLNTQAKRGYERWMFGSEQQFKLPKVRLIVTLASLMALLLALVFMNAVLVAAATAHAIGSSKSFPSPSLIVPLTSDFIVADLAALLIVIGTIGLPWLSRETNKQRTKGRGMLSFEWLLVLLGAALVFLAGWLMPFQLAGYHPESSLWPPVCAWAIWLSGGHSLFITGLWGLELGAAYGARWFLVQYVGDVAAYVAAHTVSKFYELRQQIWQTAMKVSAAVYRAQADRGPDSDPPSFLYNKVIMVGHSLGSVIGYDTLNGLLLQDTFSKNPLCVADRTRMFLTFGSPLDKTAFLFRTQREMLSPVQEVGAAAVQPMIQGYENRPEEWVNLYSKSDIISGSLEYYDPADRHDAKGVVQFQDPLVPAEMRKPVNNLRDPEARTPLAAHVEYWNGQLFADQLVRGITT